MRKRLLVFGLLLLVLASCATMGFQGRDSTSYLAFGDKLQSAVTTYKEKEPGLTEDQKREFQEAYAEACKAFQTAGGPSQRHPEGRRRRKREYGSSLIQARND